MCAPMQAFTCATCGKQWPDNYCPECCHTISAAPPKLPPAPPPIAAPPPISAPPRLKRKLPIAARIALVIVVAFAAFMAFRVVQFATYLRKHPMEKLPGQEAFESANRQIISAREGVAFGNTTEAQALAVEYSKTLKILRESFFTEGNKNAYSLSKGEFLTYCHLQGDHCVFLVHVPELRRFVRDAKGSLADLAWMNAQSIVQTKLARPPKTLALGVKGALLY